MESDGGACGEPCLLDLRLKKPNGDDCSLTACGRIPDNPYENES